MKEVILVRHWVTGFCKTSKNSLVVVEFECKDFFLYFPGEKRVYCETFGLLLPRGSSGIMSHRGMCDVIVSCVAVGGVYQRRFQSP